MRRGNDIPDDKDEGFELSRSRGPARGRHIKSVETVIQGARSQLDGETPDLFDLTAHLPVLDFDAAWGAGIAREWTETDEVAERNESAKRFLLAQDSGGFNALRKKHSDWRPDISNIQLEGRDLRKFKLDGAVLDRAVLCRADLTGMFLDDTRLNGAIMDDVRLEGAELQRAFMIGAVLYCAHLEKADLKDSKLARADLTGTVLKGADVEGAGMYATALYGADLTGVKGLTAEQLGKACFGEVKVERDLYFSAVNQVAKGRRWIDSESSGHMPGAVSFIPASGSNREQRSRTPPIIMRRFPAIRVDAESGGKVPAAELPLPLKILNMQTKNLLIIDRATEFNDLRAKNPLWKPDLTGINLTNRKLHGFDLSGVCLRRAILAEADLGGKNLDGAKLDGAMMSGAKLSGTSLRGASMIGAMLHSASLDDANLEGAVLRHAELTRSNLRNVNLMRADMYGAALKDANFSGAKNLSREQLCTASFCGARVEKNLYDEAVDLLRLGYRV